MEAITFKMMHDDKERGLDVVMQELLGRLVGRHSTELRGLYFHPFGRRDKQGEAVEYDDATRETIEPVRLYLQDLEGLIRHLDKEMEDLQVQLREKDKLFTEQDEIVKEMEARFESQDKKFKNQEKRVQDTNLVLGQVVTWASSRT